MVELGPPRTCAELKPGGQRREQSCSGEKALERSSHLASNCQLASRLTSCAHAHLSTDHAHQRMSSAGRARSMGGPWPNARTVPFASVGDAVYNGSMLRALVDTESTCHGGKLSPVSSGTRDLPNRSTGDIQLHAFYASSANARHTTRMTIGWEETYFSLKLTHILQENTETNLNR
jgi:hypothetical protein